MTTQRSTSGASKLALLAMGLPALTIATAALAEDAAAPAAASAAVAQAAPAAQATPAAKPKAKPAATTVAQAQPETNNAVVNAEATQAVTPPEQLSSQAKSNGLVADSHLNLLFRNYADVFDNEGGPHRHAWVQGMQANFESGYTKGPVGLGVDASLFASLKLDGGNGAGNMVHVAKGGGGSDQLAWAYPGMYDIKGRISETVVKYGLQIVDNNPFMEPHDNRSLPPTFLGVSAVSTDVRNVTLEAGSFTKVNARGHTNLTDMTTSYGGTTFKRLSYFGGNWDYSPNGTVSLYADQAENVWNQFYASIAQSVGDINGIKWAGLANIYSTQNTGSALQGHINNNAYSLSLSAQHGPHQVLLGFQQILGDQFFDYVNETNGIYLVNSMDVDYNAPHEKSFQLRYTFDGKHAGLPGFKAMVWGVTGWGADASAEAAANPTSSLYFRNGQPIHGTHHEIGFIPSYTLQSGRFKDTKITFIAMYHKSTAHYSDPDNMEYRLVVNVPVKVF
ncbi:OprD family outer membrane porin [Paraburkholderia sp. LEh10]|uniref:OprD family outer membrane porin n=1 Tax=Paraburkholderia sp. LEh10 TaxID=2821353 RepID=UPI001AE38D78|nr:OprD family outer membrane porin [Paraburkholderia sp. LEh10]MBP0589742.1 OprD family outer membrane porin [Paraburkholderia sp. LEh10]